MYILEFKDCYVRIPLVNLYYGNLFYDFSLAPSNYQLKTDHDSSLILTNISFPDHMFVCLLK